MDCRLAPAPLPPVVGAKLPAPPILGLSARARLRKIKKRVWAGAAVMAVPDDRSVL